MQPTLTLEELDWLQKLKTDTPEKPDVPPPVHKRLVETGYALELVEGGLQLTDLGRKALESSSAV
jgi:hypothetical protein